MSGQHNAPGRFTAGERTLVPVGWEAVWVPEPVCTLWRRELFTHSGRPARSPSLYRLSYPGLEPVY
jgi:hypothetical protein